MIETSVIGNQIKIFFKRERDMRPTFDDKGLDDAWV
jgi:hypothetical protein